jgi:hypothetical protein
MTTIVVVSGSNAPVGSLDILWDRAPPDEAQRNDAFVKALLFAQFIELVDGPVAGPDGRPLDLPGPEAQRPSSTHWQAVQAPRHRAWWTVLANMLAASDNPPARILVGGPDDDGRGAIVLPPSYAGLDAIEPDFPVEDEREGLAVQVEVEFDRAVPEPLFNAFSERTDAWFSLGALGGFKEIDEEDEDRESLLLPDGEVEQMSDILTVGISKCWVDDVAFDALNALLTTLPQGEARIVEVRLR